MVEDAFSGKRLGAGRSAALSYGSPTDVGSANANGAASTVDRSDHVHKGLHSIQKTAAGALYGDVTLSAGANVTLTQAAQNIEIAAAGGGAGNWTTLYKDMATSSHTGDLNEYKLKTYTMPGGTLGATDGLYIFCLVNYTGAAGTKVQDVYFGATQIFHIGEGAATVGTMAFDIHIFNTAANAQRAITRRIKTYGSVGGEITYATAAENTANDVEISIRATLGNAGDTMYSYMFYVVKITGP